MHLQHWTYNGLGNSPVMSRTHQYQHFIITPAGFGQQLVPSQISEGSDFWHVFISDRENTAFLYWNLNFSKAASAAFGNISGDLILERLMTSLNMIGSCARQWIWHWMKYKMNFNFLFTVESLSTAGRYKKAEEKDLCVQWRGLWERTSSLNVKVSNEWHHSSYIQL